MLFVLSIALLEIHSGKPHYQSWPGNLTWEPDFVTFNASLVPSLHIWNNKLPTQIFKYIMNACSFSLMNAPVCLCVLYKWGERCVWR